MPEVASVSAAQYDWLSRRPMAEDVRLEEGEASAVSRMADRAGKRGRTQVDALSSVSKHPQSVVLLFRAADGSILDCWSVDSASSPSLTRRKWPSMEYRGQVADVHEVDRKQWSDLLSSIRQRLPE